MTVDTAVNVVVKEVVAVDVTVVDCEFEAVEVALLD